MAYDTYQDLVDSIASYLKEDDLTSEIGDFILLFEAIARADFRHPLAEVRVPNYTVENKYQTLPSDLHSVKSLELDVATGQRWVAETGNEYIATKWGTAEAGQPQVFAIVGQEIRFGPEPDGSREAELIYWKKLPALSSEINWLYQNFPMVYLYGSLLQAESWLENDPRIGTWNALYQGAKDVMQQDARSREFGTIGRSQVRIRKV